MSKREIPRVFVRDHWHDCFREERARHSIYEAMPVVASIGGHSVAELRIGFQGHGLRGQDSSPDEGTVIEAILACQLELLPYRQRWKLDSGGHGGKVRNHSKNPLCLVALRTFFHLIRTSAWRFTTCAGLRIRLLAGLGCGGLNAL